MSHVSCLITIVDWKSKDRRFGMKSYDGIFEIGASEAIHESDPNPIKRPTKRHL
jgi:hypothetical protein